MQDEVVISPPSRPSALASSIAVRLWLPASLYRLCPYRRPDAILPPPSLESCVALGLCSRLDSTDSILGVVPPASMQASPIKGEGYFITLLNLKQSFSL